ncbi:MAG: hypothetical protein INE97_11990 [Phenylobacterium sp.]|jgi:chromosomal replication initiation ATPase DnaA|nr:hypothetical protein [Phenylobacterium sp.]
MTLMYQVGCIPGFGMPYVEPKPGPQGMDLAREIAREVGWRYGVPASEIFGPRRFRSFVLARQEVAYRLYNSRHQSGPRRFSLTQIGTWLGGRDHTTILHAIRAHERRMGAKV